MQYALLIYAAPDAPRYQPAADDGVAEDWDAFRRAIMDAGVVVAAQQLQDAGSATAVRLRGGERLLTDGPFVETKEHLLGFVLVDVPDLDAAIEWASRMPVIRYGTVEVRPVLRDLPWQGALE